MSVIIKHNSDEKSGLFAEIDYHFDDTVFILEGPVLTVPTRESIMLGPTEHIVDPFGSYLNHSCYPNVEIDGFYVTAGEDIKAGEELFFDYRENEGVLANPFTCDCCGTYITEGIYAQET